MKKIDPKMFLSRLYSMQDAIKKDYHLAKKMGWRAGLISDWNRQGSIPYPRCVEIAEKLGLDLQSLIGDKKTAFTFKYYGDTPVSAGGGAFSLSEHPTQVFYTDNEILEWLFGGIPENDIMGFQVRGDSMVPTLIDGDVVFCVVTHEWNGESIYAVRLDGHMYLKRVVKTDTGYILKSDNPEYADIIPQKGEDFAIIAEYKVMARSE